MSTRAFEPQPPETLKFKAGERVWVRFRDDWWERATITKTGLTAAVDCGTMVTFPPYEVLYDFNPTLGPVRALEENLRPMGLLDQIAEAANSRVD